MSTDTGHNSTQNDATWTGNIEQMIDLYVHISLLQFFRHSTHTLFGC